MKWNNTMIRMTPAERKAGRLMRAPDHTAGGGDSGAGGDNPQGNAGGSASQTPAGDNAGQSFDPASFWQSPPSESQQSPSGGSADSGTQGGGTPAAQPAADQGTQIGQRFAQQLEQMAFQPVFTQETANQIADGNLDGINSAMVQSHRESVRNAVTMSAQLMQTYGQHLMAQVEARIQEHFGSRDDDASLMKEFPQAAADPGIRPMISSIYKQALGHTKNNREAAIAMTRDMLKYVAKGAGTELGINDAPGNSGDNISPGALSLVEDLMSR